MTGKFTALVVCQNEYCASEVSYPLDMVRKFNGQPICQNCYEADHSDVDWCDLPKVELSDLCE